MALPPSPPKVGADQSRNKGLGNGGSQKKRLRVGENHPLNAQHADRLCQENHTVALKIKCQISRFSLAREISLLPPPL